MPPEFLRYKALIDTDIAEYSEILSERWQREFGLETAQTLESYLSILSRGGKRFRGSLGMWSYALAGGEDLALALHIARNLEMIHAYLLVVDDVADQAETRRGGPSAHILLRSQHQEQGRFGDSTHFGQMQAINAGIAVQHLVMQEVSQLAASDQTKLEAVRELSAVLFKTVIGQIADLNHQAMRDIRESEVVAMMEKKTAYYSFVSPLQFGVVMAGKDWSDYAWLEGWARNIGLGFQISDDILGVFGDEKISGKSSLSDIREGKVTLLVVRALGAANDSQKRQLLELLGDQNLSPKGLEQAQAILEDTGALQYCRSLAQNYAQKAITSLDDVPEVYRAQAAALRDLSQIIVSRQS